MIFKLEKWIKALPKRARPLALRLLEPQVMLAQVRWERDEAQRQAAAWEVQAQDLRD